MEWDACVMCSKPCCLFVDVCCLFSSQRGGASRLPLVSRFRSIHLCFFFFAFARPCVRACCRSMIIALVFASNGNTSAGLLVVVVVSCSSSCSSLLKLEFVLFCFLSSSSVRLLTHRRSFFLPRPGWLSFSDFWFFCKSPRPFSLPFPSLPRSTALFISSNTNERPQTLMTLPCKKKIAT